MSDATPASIATPLIARARPGYCLRLLLVGVGMWAAAAWFAFDASVTYPRHNQQQAQVAAFEREHGADASAKWPAYAKETGLDPNYNAAKGTAHTEMDILTQWIICGACSLFGALFLAGFAAAKRRFVRWDGVELSNHCGVRLKADEIEALEDDRWEDKGVAVAHGKVNGKPGAIKLDDWKMEAEVTAGIYDALKAIISRPPTP